jgi:hypothetical protein
MIDGEICVFNQDLVSHMHLLRGPPPDVLVGPPIFMALDAFTCPVLDVRPALLKDERKRLEDEVDGSLILPARRLAAMHGQDVVLEETLERLRSSARSMALAAVSRSQRLSRRTLRGPGRGRLQDVLCQRRQWHR